MGRRHMQASQTDMIGGQPLVPPGAQIVQGPTNDVSSSPPAEGIPPEAQSQINVASGAGGGPNILHLAKQKAHEIEKLMAKSPEEAQQHIQKLKNEVPQFLALVLQILRGKQQTRDPLNPHQMPLPDQKPPRRTAEKALV